MGPIVRVNRNRPEGCWTVHSLTHKKRIGNADGLLLRDVTFRCENGFGWAEGELVSWSNLRVFPGFPGKADLVLSMDRPAAGLIFWPLVFEDGRFHLKGFSQEPRSGCLWLRILGREAEATAALI